MSSQNPHKKSFVVWMTVIVFLSTVVVAQKTWSQIRLTNTLTVGPSNTSSWRATTPPPGATPTPRVRLDLFKTDLDVQRPDDASNPWVNSVEINSRQVVTFRWKTKAAGVSTAIWQLSQENLLIATNHPASKILASGAAGANSPAGQYKAFNIDFAQLAFVPQTPSKTPKAYYVRLVPLDSSSQVIGGFAISISVKVTYVLPSPKITAIKETRHGTFAEINFQTATPAIPVVEASTSKPGSDLSFKPEEVQSSALPLLAGYQKNHSVRLNNLTPGTTFHYVIRTKDQNGMTAKKADKFITLTQKVQVTFEEVHVIDDSDDLSEGDLDFGFYIGGDPKPLIFSSGIDSGERRAMITKMTPPPTFLQKTVTPNSKGPLMIRVVGVDDDDFDFPGAGPRFRSQAWLVSLLNRCDTGALTVLFGLDCSDSARASTSVVIYVSGPDESFTQPFTLSALGSKLKFVVKGKFQVSYN